MQQSEIEPVSWRGLERRDQRGDERFPWEYGSPRERWRGRIGALLFGAFLALLIVLSNAKMIAALEGETQHLAGAFELRSASASALPVLTIRLEDIETIQPDHARTKSLAIAPPASDPPGSTLSRVQLGSFSSETEALAASEVMAQRYEAFLKNRKPTVSEAVINGTRFYRVVIDLQTDSEANNMCDTIKKKNNDCLVWAEFQFNN